MRIHKALLLAITFGLLAQGLSAQKIFNKKRPEIFPLNGRYKLSGFHFAPGATYTLTRFSNSEEQVFSRGDSTFNATFSPSGGVGIYVEGGWFQIFKYSSIIRYADVSLGYKQIKGAESYTGVLTRVGENPFQQVFEGDGSFDESFITLSLNLNNVLQLGDRTFLQNTIGANVDYRISSTRSYSAEFGLNQQEIPGTVRAQVHYKIGFGWKVSHRVIMIPSLETPILNVYEWDDGRSEIKYFSSRYRPIIFSLRFMLLRQPKGADCVPVKKEKKSKKSKVYRQESYHP